MNIDFSLIIIAVPVHLSLLEYTDENQKIHKLTPDVQLVVVFLLLQICSRGNAKKTLNWILCYMIDWILSDECGFIRQPHFMMQSILNFLK